MKMIEKKRFKGKKNIFLKIAVFIFILYIAFLMVQQQISLKSKKEQLASLQQQVAVQRLKNDELRTVLNATNKKNEKYIEKKAKENLDYCFPDEQVFVGVAGE